MIHDNNEANSSPLHNNDPDFTLKHYLQLAAQARQNNESMLALHLFLAAFEESFQGTALPNEEVLFGLKEAWAIACRLKERSLAEYIFEKLEPYLTSDEVSRCAEELQKLSLEKLEEYGLNRDELENLSDLISQELLEYDAFPARFLTVEHVSMHHGAFENARESGSLNEEERSDVTNNDSTDVSEAARHEITPQSQINDYVSAELDTASVVSVNTVNEPNETVGPVDVVIDSYSHVVVPGNDSVVEVATLMKDSDPKQDRNLSKDSALPEAKDEASSEGESSPPLPFPPPFRVSSPVDKTGKANEDCNVRDGLHFADPRKQADFQPPFPKLEKPPLVKPDISTSQTNPPIPSARNPFMPVSGHQEGEAVPSMRGAQSNKQDPEIPDISFTYKPILYSDLVGFDEAIALMRSFGIGVKNDPEFKSLVTLLNSRHGLSTMPAPDSLLFRAPVREDANRFMEATLGELKLPAIRMRIEENLAGMPVLCVMTQTDSISKLNSQKSFFNGPGALVLEDIDLWGTPSIDCDESIGGFLMAQLSRGAREAINMIRSAVEHPDVYVLASSPSDTEIDTFFCELLSPFTMVDIDYPTTDERAKIWDDIAQTHPSIQNIDRTSLIDLSAHLPRFDMYMAAREAVEEAYKHSLLTHSYAPVSAEALYEKLASYQPLSSDEYQMLEDAAIADFSENISAIEHMLATESFERLHSDDPDESD